MELQCLSYLLFDFLKTITDTRLGQDVAWSQWIALDLSAQIADIDPQQVGIYFIIPAPNLIHQLMMSKHLPGMHDQDSQNVVFCRCENDRIVVDLHFALRKIDHQFARLIYNSSPFRFVGPAQGNTYPC